MKSTTKKILDEIKKTTENLFFLSANEYPFQPFVWEIVNKGELTLGKLLQSEGFIRQVTINDIFPQYIKSFKNHLSAQMQTQDYKQQELIEFLQLYCKSVEIYFTSNCEPEEPYTEYESFPLIIVETQVGEWIGIAPEVDAEFSTRVGEYLFTDYAPYLEKDIWDTAFGKIEYIPPQNQPDFYVRFDLESLLKNSEFPYASTSSWTVKDAIFMDENIGKILDIHTHQNKQISQSTLSLAAAIKELLVGMRFLTRQYYESEEVERFVMKAATSRELLLYRLLNANGFSGICQFKEFGEIDESYDYQSEELTYFKKLKLLDRVLLSNLSNLREYVVGCMSIFYLYSVGQTSDGDWIGVKTTAIWA